MNKPFTYKDYITNPDADPIKAIIALRGKYAGSNFLSAVESSARGAFSLTTSILKNTYRVSTDVSKYLNQVVKPKQKIVSALSSLIGKDGTQDAVNFVQQARADYINMYKQKSQEIALKLTGKNNPTVGELIASGSAKSIRSIKLNAMAMAGFNFKLDEIVKNALLIDIETGGLFKDAPILQIAMGDMARIEELKKMTNLSARGTDKIISAGVLDSINKMSPRMQMDQGFLSMNVMPSAIIRDTSRVGIDEAGKEFAREPTYKAFEYMPESMDRFKEDFGDWAEKKYSWLNDFYNEFGENGIIGKDKLAELNDKLNIQGFVELQSGQRIYSQREAAKWSMIFAKKAADDGRTLMGANTTFESFRVGKLWEYFIDNRGQAKPGEKPPFNLAMFPDDVSFLNQDEDMQEAFGQMDGMRDLRKMLSATWKSDYKRNILDSNNYTYGVAADRLKATGRSDELINLFPSWMKSISSGLDVRDQQDLTKMLFSGLMQTGYTAKSTDIVSGSAIDYASKAILGVDEEHKALQDVIVQGRILTDGKLASTVNDVYNIHKAATSSLLSDQIKSSISILSMLLNPTKRAWFDLSDSIRETKFQIGQEDLAGTIKGTESGITGFEKFLSLSATGQIEGTAIDLNKAFNIDKELLRLNESVDSWTNVDGGLFRKENRAVTRFVVPGQAAGEIAAIELPTDSLEPFSLVEKTGRQKHEMLTSQGESLFIYKDTHDYGLEDTVREQFERLTRPKLEEAYYKANPDAMNLHGTSVLSLADDGSTISTPWELTDEEIAKVIHPDEIEAIKGTARAKIKSDLMERYAETPQIGSRGLSADDLHTRLQFLMGSVFGSVEEARTELRDRLSGSGGKRFGKALSSQLNPILSAIYDSTQGKGPSVAKGLTGAFDDARQRVMAARNVKGLNSGAKLTLMQKVTTTLDTAVNILGNEKSYERFVSQTFGVSEKFSQYAIAHAGRAFGVAGAAVLGAGVGAAGYAVDMPSWKPTTEDILRMSGNEKEILPEGNYEKGGKLQSVTAPMTQSIAHTNEAGVALQAIDSSKVDYAIGDGDTIQILSKGFFGLGRRSLGSVRVSGIDTPEVSHGGEGAATGISGGQPFSQPGKNYLTNVLSARTGAQVAISERQTFGRNVGLVTTESGENVSYNMVKQGLGSVLYRETPEQDLVSQKDYNIAERSARLSNEGMWKEPFYYGAQSGIAGADRKGWNRLTASTMYKYNFDQSAGSSFGQMQSVFDLASPPSRQEAVNMAISPLDNGAAQQEADQIYYQKKERMAVMQQNALMNSMQRNRGRGKERR